MNWDKILDTLQAAGSSLISDKVYSIIIENPDETIELFFEIQEKIENGEDIKKVILKDVAGRIINIGSDIILGDALTKVITPTLVAYGLMSVAGAPMTGGASMIIGTAMAGATISLAIDGLDNIYDISEHNEGIWKDIIENNWEVITTVVNNAGIIGDTSIDWLSLEKIIPNAQNIYLENIETFEAVNNLISFQNFLLENPLQTFTSWLEEHNKNLDSFIGELSEIFSMEKSDILTEIEDMLKAKTEENYELDLLYNRGYDMGMVLKKIA